MRRLLMAAAVSVPIAVVAAIAVAPTGKVVDLDNYNVRVSTPTSYINAEQCLGTKQLNLQWSTVRSATLTASAVYKLYASNTAPYTSGDNVNYCPEAPITGGGTSDVWANQLGDQVAWDADIQGAQFSGKDAADAQHANVDCTRDGAVVYICAHLYDGTRKGYASGRFEVQVAAPEAPTITDVGPASETSLAVSWSEPASGVQVDHYEAVATAGAEEHRSGTTQATDATISGLTEGTPYSVVVYAYSVGGNPSVASGAVEGTPGPVFDFWETYVNAGGRDSGGCASGAAGPLALLAVAALVRLRRRK